jgi:DNA-binding MarR family transcriptional regulator
MAAARCLEARGESIFTWQVVCFLVRNGPTSQRDLAYANAQHPAGISRLVEELEGEGLVSRAADPNDRRKQLVEATPKGRTWLEGATPSVMQAVDQTMSGLSNAARSELRVLLEALLAEDEGAKRPKLPSSPAAVSATPAKRRAVRRRGPARS